MKKISPVLLVLALSAVSQAASFPQGTFQGNEVLREGGDAGIPSFGGVCSMTIQGDKATTSFTGATQYKVQPGPYPSILEARIENSAQSVVIELYADGTIGSFTIVALDSNGVPDIKGDERFCTNAR